MNLGKWKFKALLLVLVLLLALFTNQLHAQTQEPEVVISWKAASLTPDWYSLKALPIANTSIRAKVMVIDDGQTVDLLNSQISWALNEELIGQGLGLTSIEFSDAFFAKVNYQLKAKVLIQNQELTKTISIPVVSPFLVGIDQAEGLKLEPYFFNASNGSQLTSEWKLNKAEFALDQLFLDFGIIGELTDDIITIEAKVYNPVNSLERAVISRSYQAKTNE